METLRKPVSSFYTNGKTVKKNLDPLVSIIIPAFNAEEYLKEALNSSLSQDYKNTEIIVIDDDSTDKTVETALQFKNVKLLKQPHRGACAARNMGLIHCKGDLIKFLDSDDILAPSIISKQVACYLECDPHTIVYSDIAFFSTSKKNSKLATVELSQTTNQSLQLLKTNIHTPCSLYPKNALLAVKGFDPRFLKAQEYYLNLKLSLAGYKFLRLPGTAALARIHNSYDRISNQKQTKKSIENSELRERVYIETFNEAFDGQIPKDIQKYFADKIIKNALIKLCHGNFKNSLTSISNLLMIKPSPFLLTSCVVSAAMDLAIGRIKS